ncbi:hypothetical protein K458DRAFT_323572 [Lentithecium fluviatile CBS 122367]|uniref:Zn(2)-C6 fungal-type domain-containing protein n=1 Tax=Lentithecium fluviatile CBS 122367 TaxID=1168545 RepID=A0A6G1ICC1_9PLEO|nr:hypothetical protein K458DRAFT_323572 [Lentithecium fluviatile CBS 122367]
MVYRGRPSMGCKKCRQRKIKCDERPGGCIKCFDKNFPCPGYDNPLDRFFQDESAAVQAKAQKSKAKALIARDERDRNARANARTKAAPTTTEQALNRPLLCPLIDQGITYFMSTYALGLDQPPVQSSFYNKHLSTYGFHPLIATTMTALGLAGAANLLKDAALKIEAMKWYLNALHMTNQALASPTQVKSDNTLFATLLLSVFESTSNETSLIAWANHVAGSASLLRMRGKTQFATPAGRRMYLQTVGMLTIKCMGEGAPVPDFVHTMNAEVEKWEDRRDPANRFYHLHIAVADLRAEILQGKIASLDDILTRALALDATAQNIFTDVDPGWTYETAHCAPGTPGVFGTYYHIYPSLAAAQTWNWVHYNRIYLLDIIRNSLIAGFSATPPVFVGGKYMRMLEEATEALYKMQADILASMPQHMHDTPKAAPTAHSDAGLGLRPEGVSYAESGSGEEGTLPSTGATPEFATLPSEDSASPSTAKLFTTNFATISPPRTVWTPTSPAIPRDQLPIIRVSGGYSSLFALFIAGATPIASPESQAYVIRTLYRVSSEFGINQAKVLAGALEYKMRMCRGVGNEWVEEEEGMGKGRWDVVPVYLPTVGPHVED